MIKGLNNDFVSMCVHGAKLWKLFRCAKFFLYHLQFDNKSGKFATKIKTI